MARNSLQCPSCGERMPRGLELCLFCQAPLKAEADVADDGKPPLTDVSPVANIAVAEQRSIGPRKVRRTKDRVAKAQGEQVAPRDESNPISAGQQRPVVKKHLDGDIAESPGEPAVSSSAKVKIVAGIVVLLLLAPLIVSGPVPGGSSALTVT